MTRVIIGKGVVGGMDLDMGFVLLVEDDPDMRQDLAFLIEHRGHTVQTAAHGKEALDKLAEHGAPCLILLDLMMPVMDGWELRAELLGDPDLAGIPVVLLSGVADVQQEARSLQAVDYLTKPIDFQRLYQLVDKLC